MTSPSDVGNLFGYQADGWHTTPQWGVVLGIELPPGVQRHPRVLDSIHQELGRSCSLDTGETGFRIGFPAFGGSIEEAEEEVEGVAFHLLALLGLSEQAITEWNVRPWNLDADQMKLLSIVTDQR